MCAFAAILYLNAVFWFTQKSSRLARTCLSDESLGRCPKAGQHSDPTPERPSSNQAGAASCLSEEQILSERSVVPHEGERTFKMIWRNERCGFRSLWVIYRLDSSRVTHHWGLANRVCASPPPLEVRGSIPLCRHGILSVNMKATPMQDSRAAAHAYLSHHV